MTAHVGVNPTEPSVGPGAAGSAGGSPPGPAAPGPTLRARAVRGSAWTVLGYGAGYGLRLITNPMLATLVSPAVFGVMRIANTVMQGLQMFSAVGLGPAVMQSRRGEEPAFLNTVWTIQALRGLLLCVVAAALAWPMAAFYDAPSLLIAVPALGLTAVISGFDAASRYTESRHLRIGAMTAIGVCENAVNALLTLAWAVFSPTIWALVGASVVSRFLGAASAHVLLPHHRHRFAWDRDAAREIFEFGKWIFVGTVITFFARESDKLLGGKLLSMETLGVYSVALTVAGLPRDVILQLSEAVLYSALAEKARREPERLHEHLLRARAALLPAGVAAILGMALAAPWFFRLFYSSEYADAVWMAPVLGAGVWFGILQVSADRALLAVGDTRALAASSLVRAVVTLGACAGGYALWGGAGFVAGVTLGALGGHVAVAAALRARSMPIAAQDLRFTGILAAGVAAGFGLPWLVRAAGGAAAGDLAEIVAPIVVAAAAGLWAVRTTLPLVVRR